MLKNFLVIAVRNILRNSKSHALLNILGLSVAFCCAILITLFITDEYSYDRHHVKADRIFRVVHNWKTPETVTPWARTSAPIGPMLLETKPEIEQMTRVRKNPRTDLLAYGEKKFNEDMLIFADSTFFKVFSFGLLNGNPGTALSNPNSILLTAKMARKYFGNDDPIGKLMRYNNAIDLMVTGILEEVPANSHFTFNSVVTFATLVDVIGERRTNHWGWFDHHTYILVKPGTNMQEFDASLPQFLTDHGPEWLPERMELFTQQLASIHLQSDLKDELEINSNPQYSYILLTVAIFILAMASINFMNLATAKYSSKSVEVGVRKVLGAQRAQLAKYYLVESMLLSLISFIFSLLLVAIVADTFNDLTGKSIAYNLGDNLLFLLAFLLFSLLLGLLAGSYPALFLSSLRPSQILKGTFVPGMSTALVRKILVVTQFTISIVMIIGTLVVSYQLNFFHDTSFGFKKDQILIVPIKDRSQNSRYETIRGQIQEIPGVKNVSFSSSIPGSNNSMTFTYFFPASEIAEQQLPTFMSDEYFLDIFDVDILSGSAFQKAMINDSTRAVIINEAAVKFFGLEEPIGLEVRGNAKGRIIAVLKDFNFKSLHDEIEPLVLFIEPRWFRYIAIKLDADQVKTAIAGLEGKWRSIYDGNILEYSFLDDNINQLYQAENKLRNTFQFFAVVALVITALGLVGLGSFTVEKRTKEIGIRKVLGSSSGRILGLLYADFLKLLGFALIVAWPLSYYLMSTWLQSFAHRISITWDIFAVPVAIVVGLLAVSIGYQSMKASTSNPIQALRDE